MINNYGLLDNWDSKNGRINVFLNIILQGNILKLHLIEYLDYIIIPQEVWNALYDWYNGGPTIEIEVSIFKNKPFLNIYDYNERNVKNRKKLCRVCLEPSRFTCALCENTYYCSKSCQMSDYYIHINNCDKEKPDLPCEYRGLVGLSNIGNTCYMDAALQCLSHTYPLTLYFLRKQYVKHINIKVYNKFILESIRIWW